MFLFCGGNHCEHLSVVPKHDGFFPYFFHHSANAQVLACGTSSQRKDVPCTSHFFWQCNTFLTLPKPLTNLEECLVKRLHFSHVLCCTQQHRSTASLFNDQTHMHSHSHAATYTLTHSLTHSKRALTMMSWYCLLFAHFLLQICTRLFVISRAFLIRASEWLGGHVAVPYSGTRQMMYQTIKGYLMASGIYASSPSQFVLLAVVAMTSGAIGQFVANPTDVLKVHAHETLMCVCCMSWLIWNAIGQLSRKRVFWATCLVCSYVFLCPCVCMSK